MKRILLIALLLSLISSTAFSDGKVPINRIPITCSEVLNYKYLDPNIKRNLKKECREKYGATIFENTSIWNTPGNELLPLAIAESLFGDKRVTSSLRNMGDHYIRIYTSDTQEVIAIVAPFQKQFIIFKQKI